ncbi:MAG: hypothetical protein ACE361_11770 [Aureliella sp.]
MGDQTINSILRLTTEGNSLFGTYENQTMDANIVDGKIDNGAVSFRFEAEVDGSEVEAKFAGKVSGDEIKGTVNLSLAGEDYGEFDWNPSRFVGKDEVVGTWEFRFTAADGNEYTPVLTIKEDNGKVFGEIGGEGESAKIESIEIKDNQFTFDYSTDYQGSELNLTYKCSPVGHHLSGICEFELQGETGEFDIAAKRRHLSRAASEMLGTWEFEIQTPEGQNTAILSLSDDNGELAASLTGDGNQFELSDVKLDKKGLRFGFKNEHSGMSVDLFWLTNLDSDGKMTGTLTFDADGNTGDIPLSGKRRVD